MTDETTSRDERLSGDMEPWQSECPGELRRIALKVLCDVAQGTEKSQLRLDAAMQLLHYLPKKPA